MVICSAILIILMQILYILKRANKIHLLLNVGPYLYFFIAALSSTLIYNDWIPEKLKDGPKDVFEF
jgi:hypothetical protein